MHYKLFQLCNRVCFFLSQEKHIMDPSLFGGAPRFLTRPKTCSMCTGKDATLSCTVVGSPTPLITWEKDKLKLKSGGRFKTLEDGDVYRLTIYELSLEDSGQYMCRAKNNVGEAYAAVTLKVALPAEMAQRAPVFLEKPTSARVGLGGDVVFHCRVAAHPEANFDWEKDGRYLGESNRIKVVSENDLSTLKIQSVRNLDSGTYTCRAQNSVGRAHASAALVVDTQDSQRTSTTITDKGKHAKLSCLVTGHPKPHIIWRKDGSNMSEGRRHVIYEDQAENFILKILYCKQSDNGLYTCNATNMAGQTYSAVLVTVKEPKVPFKRKLQDVEVQEKSSATMMCEVPHSITQTSWFMEETKLEQNTKFRMEQDGTLRRLTIHNVTTNDDGVYICETQEGSRTVAELTVLGKGHVHDLLRGAGAPCPDAFWTRNGEKLKQDSRISIGCSVRQYTLTIRDCQALDSGEVAFVAGDCKTSTPARKHPPDPPVNAVVQNKTDSSITFQWSPPESDRPVPIKGYVVEKRKIGAQQWQRCNPGELVNVTEFTICNFTEEATYQFRMSAVNDFGQSPYMEVPGSFYLATAELKKGLTDSVAIAGEEFSISVELSAVCSGFWSLGGRLLRSGGDYLITRTKNVHTLLIRTVTMEMSGTEVKFVGGGSQTTCVLNVKGTPTATANVGRKPSSANAFFKTAAFISAFSNKESVQKDVIAVLTQKATLSCNVSDSKTEVKWYKDGKQIISSRSVYTEVKGTARVLVIEKMEKSDAGEYTCEAAGEKLVFKIAVTGIAPNWGEKATLSCEVSESNTEVKWYKDGKLVTSSKTVHAEAKGKSRQLVIDSVEKSNAGEYICEAGTEKLVFKLQVCSVVSNCDFLSISSWYNVTVLPSTDAKVRSAFSNKESIQREVKAVLSQSVTLSCEVADSKTEVKWYKDGKLLTSTKTIHAESKGMSRQLVIDKVEKKDAGEYVCEVGTEKLVFKINVEESIQREVKATLSQKATLSCEVADSKMEVKWYKDGKLLSSSRTVHMESKEKTRRLVFDSVEKKDAGEYICEAGSEKLSFKIQVTEIEQKSPKQVKITTKLNNVAAMEGKEAIFKCAVTPADANVKWFHNNVPVTVGQKYKTEHGGTSFSLTITAVTQKDAGEVSVDAEGKTCKATLQVQHEPVTFKKKLENLTVEEQSDARLEVELSKASNDVRWMKNSVVIQPAGNIQIQVNGAKQTLVIKSVTTADRGFYSCETLDDKTQAKLNVEMKKIQLVKGLKETKAGETQTVTLEVELSQADVDGSWTRDGSKLRSGSSCKITVLGKKHVLTLSSLKREDAGMIAFQADGVHTSAKLIVTEPPVMICKPILDITAAEKEKVTFECEVSRASGDIKWFKVIHGKILSTQNQSVMEKESATFVCELSHDDVDYQWSKGSSKIKASDNIRMRQEGTIALHSVSIEDMGEIKFTAEKASSSAKLKVKGNRCPVVTDVSIVHRGHLECQVSRASAKVKWYKNKTELKAGKKYEIKSEDVYRQLTVNDVDSGDEDTYVCDAADDKTSCKLLVEGNSEKQTLGCC
uniref:Obscurin, cytoskeletal calmodulin and titin-interacting RhoGEF b n=1 Tax=Neogobius melanostomus TaxID=47308 RepID=A0A8C6U7Z3_9GOBI